MVTVPANASDGRSLQYRYADIHVPLEVVASFNPNDTVDAAGWAGSATIYYGGHAYQGTDSADSRVIPVMGRRYHAVSVQSAQVAGGGYSVSFEGSLDGYTWESNTAIVANGVYQYTKLYKFTRFRVASVDTTGANTSQPYGLRILYLAVAE